MKIQYSRPSGASIFLLGLIVFGLLCAAAMPVDAQGEQPAPPAPTPTPEPTPITASEIPARSAELTSAIRDMEVNAKPKAEVASIVEALPEELERIADFDTRIGPLVDSDGPSDILRDAVGEADLFEARLSKWLDTLASRTASFDEALAELKRERELWQLTLDGAETAMLPPALVRQIRETLGLIQDAEERIGARRAQVLTLQVQVAEQRGHLRAVQKRLRSEIEDRQLHLWRLDSPPIWEALGEGPAGAEIAGQLLDTLKKNGEIIASYFREDAERFVLHLVVFAIVLALFIRLSRRAELWAQTDVSLGATAALLQRPVASSLLVTIVVLGGWIHPKGPAALLNLSAFVLLMIMLRLLPKLIRRELLPVVTMLVVLVGLFLLVELIPNAYLLNRLGKLMLAVLGTAACVWVIRRVRRLDPPKAWSWRRAAGWLVRVSAVFFFVSALANIIGCVALATLFAMATLSAVYDAIVLWVFITVLFGAVTVALRTPTARQLLTVRYHDDKIRTVVFKVIRLAAVASWAVMALRDFGVFDRLEQLVKGVLLYEISVGTFAVSLSDVVVFFLVVWLATKLAQLVSFFLDEDVLPRIDLPRGAAPAISKMSQYVVLTIGLMIAVAAAGLDLSRLTIVVGALGVGIGFGLQNVVNNFVSGLILLFERPVNLGDRIQVGEISGVVRDIGIRASVVRTWQGADVVVPNASLISDNLINWTLTDQLRRMDIQVGVAYGTPPARVISLLHEVAAAHAEVMDDPEPVAIFTGFGDSSLDFELRAWTVGDFVAVASDLRVAIGEALAGAGIEIPFPQRDLHLRTVAERAGAHLAGEDAMAPNDGGGHEPPPGSAGSHGPEDPGAGRA